MKLTGAVQQHKNQTHNLFKASEQELLIRLPVPRVSAGVNPLFGDFTRETDTTGEEIGPIKCIWYDALSGRNTGQSGTGFEIAREAMAGRYRHATAFAEVWLDDVLVDLSKPRGETWVDYAKDIVYLDNIYEPIGEVRLGLATATPYILMIVLRGSAGLED